MRKIVITGAESTGKTELTGFLAREFSGFYVPEFARGYVQQLNTKYTYADVEHMAKKQIELVRNAEKGNPGFIFIDTFLIIFKVWFVEVFGYYPDWLEESIHAENIDLYLVCYPDLPWIPDPVRENGGEKRLYLHHRYLEELKGYNLPREIIKGDFNNRNKKAVEIINSYFIKD